MGLCARDDGLRWDVHKSLETLPFNDGNCSQETPEFYPCKRAGKNRPSHPQPLPHPVTPPPPLLLPWSLSLMSTLDCDTIDHEILTRAKAMLQPCPTKLKNCELSETLLFGVSLGYFIIKHANKQTKQIG